MSSGSLLSLCLGEPEDGVVRVLLVLNLMFASPCSENIVYFLYMLYSGNIVYKKIYKKRIRVKAGTNIIKRDVDLVKRR